MFSNDLELALTLARFGDVTARILVGEDKVQFTVHRDLISASSNFFKKVFGGDFKEHDGEVSL
jgi:hypothetical protein